MNVGGFGARLSALLHGEVEAASLLSPQIEMAKQLGLRSVIEDTFHTIWWVPADVPAEVVRSYLRALARAEDALETDLEKFLPLWELSIPSISRIDRGISANSAAVSVWYMSRCRRRNSMRSCSRWRAGVSISISRNGNSRS